MIEYIGKKLELEVVEKTDLGYILIDDQNQEFFMHSNQSVSEIVDGKVQCFIYVDKNKRLTATSENAILTVGETGFLEVKEVNRNLGVFVDNGIVKDVLLSKNDLPKNFKLWPKIDDKVLVTLNATFTNLIVKPLSYKEVKNVFAPKEKLDEEVTHFAYVLWIGEQGINLATELGHSIFVHKSNYRGNYRVGQRVEVKLTNMKNKSDYNGSLILDKVSVIKSDSDIVYDYMLKNGGKMTYNNKSDSDEIKTEFDMSKASFKRAVSNLYKERKIDKSENGWYIVDKV